MKKNSGSNQNKKRIVAKSDQRREFTLRVPKNICIIPDRFVTHLRWWKSTAVNLSASSTAALRFSPSSAQDPDFAGSNQPVGFDKLAGLYNSYRVLSSGCKSELVTTGTVACTQTVLPSNTDPGATPTASYISASRLQAYAKSKTGALAGGPICSIEHNMSTQVMFGNAMTNFDDNFAALVNTVPVNNWFWVVTFYCLAVAPAAFVHNFFMDIEIEFYDRAILPQV